MDAPNNRVLLVDSNKPATENWTVLIPEKPDVLTSISVVGGKLFTSFLKDASTHIYQYDLAGNLEKEIPLPALGTAAGFGAKKEDTLAFYTFTSFTYPPTIYKYDIPTGTSEVFRRTEVKFNPDDFEVKQVFYPSQDGTKIPMFIVHKRGLVLDGKRPTLLYAYGGFNASTTPYFNVSNLILLENDGVYASANLREAVNTATPGTRPGCWRKSRTSSMTSSPPRNTDPGKVHVLKNAGYFRRVERRAAGRRLHDPASGALPGRLPGCRRHGHAALPQVHRRLGLVRGVRFERQSRAV